MAYTPAANEALFDLTVEEGCEIGVERSKMRRSGHHYRPFSDPADEPYIPGSPTNFEAYKAEVYDQLTLFALLFERGLIDREEYLRHYPKKIAKLRKWAPEIFEETNGSD